MSTSKSHYRIKNHNILILSKKRFAKSFYSKTPLLKIDASRFMSVSAQVSEKLSGSVNRPLAVKNHATRNSYEIMNTPEIKA
jgi:hypothetical protein